MGLEKMKSIKLDKNSSLFTDFSSLSSDLLNWIENRVYTTFIVWDESNLIRYVTPSVKDLLGFDQEELFGLPWYEGLQPLEPQRVNQLLANETDQKISTELVKKNNDVLYADITMSQFRDSSSDQNLVIAAIQDLTPRKNIETLTIQAEKMSTIGQLVASTVHEVRNPLTSIKGFLQLLQAGVKHKEEYYRIMADEIEKIESITSDLLLMAKPSKRKMKVEKISKLIKDVIILLETQARLKGITIEFDECSTDVIYCDRSQIKQVLINLVKNAIEAMEEPGTITLSTKETEEHTIVSVKDEGIGIPEEIIQQLEVAFFTTKEHGTGLGLSITKEILKDHGGHLNIIRNERKGSTFQLIFPKVKNEDIEI